MLVAQLAGAVFIMVLGQAALAQSAGSERDPYLVQPGDMLFISVWREAELQGDVLVRPDGQISFPLAGELTAAGRTIEDLRADLTERLSRYIPDLFVTVTIREILGNKIYVLGQVNNPGAYVMNPRLDVTQALSIAGGTTAFASLGNIRILRRAGGRQEVLGFDFSQVARGQRLEQNVMLESGDVVLVP
jgi:polysaccharide export outer membrane protein